MPGRIVDDEQHIRLLIEQTLEELEDEEVEFRVVEVLKEAANRFGRRGTLAWTMAATAIPTLMLGRPSATHFSLSAAMARSSQSKWNSPSTGSSTDQANSAMRTTVKPASCISRISRMSTSVSPR